ncbi:hypothetical protein [Glycomyces buryatensis]|uniref:Uncharacterized protein n=1 Tax=Glycomyces buryatensis TaxID=2570927 RepID=A0A4S8QJ13_9ACTN|nr:hypothetical protein [Glycomyces buryatensis]THV42995.1 hypothetical protein FAB82_03310 [Glycomyces buryatensis]
MTGEAGESLAEEVEGAMKHYKEYIDFEADAIKDCAKDWDDVDNDIKSKFEDIGTKLSSFKVPRISGGA